MPAVANREARRRRQQNQEHLQDLPKHRQRRKQYRQAQQLFAHDPGRLMTDILRDSLGTPQTIPLWSEEFWTELLSIDSPEVGQYVMERMDHLNILLDPILEDEIVSLLRKKRKGAAGSDGWTWKNLKTKIKTESASLIHEPLAIPW